jgi:hypothetical protein
MRRRQDRMSIISIYQCDLCKNKTDEVIGFDIWPMSADSRCVRHINRDDPSKSLVHICDLCRKAIKSLD